MEEAKVQKTGPWRPVRKLPTGNVDARYGDRGKEIPKSPILSIRVATTLSTILTTEEVHSWPSVLSFESSVRMDNKGGEGSCATVFTLY